MSLPAVLPPTTVLVLIVALVVFLLAYNRWTQRRGRERHPPEGESLEVDGVSVHVVRGGTGPPVVCLHGLNGFLQDFTGELFEELAEDHEVIVIDRPGYGNSDRPREELSDLRVQADWLARLFAELEIEEPVLLGHSLGGALAMTYAQAHPGRVAGLVLVGPYVYPGTEPEGWIHRLPRVPFLRTFVARLLLVPIGRLLAPRIVSAGFDPEPVPEGYLEMWMDLSFQPDHFETTLDEVRAIDPTLASVCHRWHEVDAPTVIVAGDRDRSVDSELNARALAEVLPNGELVWLEQAGHMLPYTRPGAIAEAVRKVGKRGRS